VTPPAAAAPAARARPADGRPRLAPGARPARRISGPARRRPPATGARRLQRGGPALELISALERLSSHRLLDRLIRGQAWLMLVTFALIGIVTLQLTLLKLNGAVGRALESQALLQRENAALSIENSELAATGRIQSGAAQMGMEFASSAALRFLTANSASDLRRSASVLSAPLHPASTGGEESTPGAGAASASAQSSEQSAGETHSTEAAAGAAASASSEAGAPQTSQTPAGGEAAEAPSQAAQAPAASSPSSASPSTESPSSSSPTSSSPAGGAQAGPSG
jgi:hypothetical protein